MKVPSTTRIVNRALDLRGDAQQQHDSATVNGIDTLVKNLYRGAKAKWATDGALLVTSVNTLGAVYVVTERACDCQAYRPCWHLRLRALLLDMFETEVETADMHAIEGR